MTNWGLRPPFFARIKARHPAPKAASKIYIDASRPQACEAAGIASKTYIKRTRPQAWRAARQAIGICKAPKKMCKCLAKFAKINATVKQLAVNKRDTI